MNGLEALNRAEEFCKKYPLYVLAMHAELDIAQKFFLSADPEKLEQALHENVQSAERSAEARKRLRATISSGKRIDRLMSEYQDVDTFFDNLKKKKGRKKK